jgi:hypothetical protein
MPTISDLFKSQKGDLYGKSDNIRIESRGLINPPRAAALLLSTPNSLGDLIGNQLAGAIGGSANRPSDTIFRGKSFLSKPISLFKTQTGLRNAVNEGDQYFVKQAPAGASILGKIKQGASTPLGAVATVGIDLLQGLKKKNPTKGSPYGQKYQTDISGKTLQETKTFSGFYETYEYKQLSGTSKGPESWVVTGIEKREDTQLIDWDDKNKTALLTTQFYNMGKNPKGLAAVIDLDTALNASRLQNQVWVLFKKAGNHEIIPFAGTVTGLSEDVTPEWTNFRYLGSPFKTYRYQGVERSLKFELKLYYTSGYEKDAMIKKINYLKSLAFPYEQISEIKYSNKNAENPIDAPVYSQYAFSPNLVTLTIGDVYKNMFGFIESLSFSIDDNTTWPNANHNMDKDGDNSLYPSVVSVSIGFKIIENHTTHQNEGITKYKYNFDGLENMKDLKTYGKYNILETRESPQKEASPIPNQPSNTTSEYPSFWPVISQPKQSVAKTKTNAKGKKPKNILTPSSAGESLSTNTSAGTYQNTTTLTY